MRYCKDIVHLLFWKLWECLTIPIKIIVWICSNLLYLSACKKVPFITHFFLKILQGNSKLVILSNLSMPGHTPKMIVYINLRKHLTFMCRQKINYILHIFLELFFYCKDIVNLFWVLWTCLAMHTQSDTINLLETFAFICRRKKSTSSPMLFWRLVDSILAYKSRTRILPNMGLVVKYQQQY